MRTAINRSVTATSVIGLCFSISVCASNVPPAWQNPDIGLTIDAIADAHDAPGSWKSPGLSIRGAELIASANIDPYAFFLGNVLISQHGAELHEAFAEFPSLPLNLTLKSGLMLANFGRWNRFHTHAMPFVSEPRIYKEYAGGMLALRGAELSWLLPIPHYLELTVSAYDLITGHTHDTDPADNSPEVTVEEVAAMIGAVPHGSHYDYEGRHIDDIAELYAIAGLATPNDPKIYRGLRRPAEFAYGGRIASSFEFAAAASADVGASVLYQTYWKQSQRTAAGFPEAYDKLLWGTDIVFFWHPLHANKYRNLQAGLELLGSRESFERLVPFKQVVDAFRIGGTAHVDYQHTQQWHVGAFGSLFESNNLKNDTRIHAGVYVTCQITHYQYIRCEFSRFEYPDYLDGVNRCILQYDATIGYHTHGRQR